MRSEITQSAADVMNKVDTVRQSLKNDIADIQRSIESAKRTLSVAKLTLADLEDGREANWARAS